MPKWLRVVLRLIKMECKSHDFCEDCPIFGAKHCRIGQEIPLFWDLEEEDQ